VKPPRATSTKVLATITQVRATWDDADEFTAAAPWGACTTVDPTVVFTLPNVVDALAQLLENRRSGR
jgi:hypothetical protein